jgi:hypothetical protein
MVIEPTRAAPIDPRARVMVARTHVIGESDVEPSIFIEVADLKSSS